MSNFNYQKAYCTIAVPAFQALSEESKRIHALLIPLVGDMGQGKDLNIPLTPEIKSLLDQLSTGEVAEMVRASYFCGHWKPSHLPNLFDNAKGESWKIANCCDQILRQQLDLPYNIQIHEGVFRVTFSNKDCWLWEEFGLAIEENLQIFKNCSLPFGENSLRESAEKLKIVCNDLWPDVESVPDNDLYKEFLALEKTAKEVQIKKQFADKIEALKQKQIDAQKEIDFLLECNNKGIDTDNVIYYSHTNTFCFGWRDKLSEKENETIKDKLGDMTERYKIDFKAA